ncbi:MAG: AMP-binding protein [Pseudomonadota bacterium]
MYTVALTEAFFPAQTDTPFELTTMRRMMEAQAARHADQPALCELTPDGARGRAWTYRDLHEDAERLGRALASRHAQGARVAIFANNIPEWVIFELAAAYAGVVMVTVNPSFGPRELTYVLRQSGAEAVYYVPSVRGSDLGATVAAARAELPDVRHQILLTDPAALFAGEDEGALRDTEPGDVVQIQYTSGTTGFPKGALLHQGGILQNARDTAARYRVGESGGMICAVPLFHTSGCVLCVLTTLLTGGELLTAPMFDPVMIVDVVEREQIAFMGGVPTMLVAMMEAARQTGKDMTCVNGIMSGGSMVAPELVRKAREVFGATVQIIYGQTEASPGITAAWPGDAEADLCGTIGQPYPHMDVAILDPKTGAVAPLDAQGEICVRGYNVMTGYNDNPEATAATIDGEGWLHTGDLGTMDARGYLKITGRVKEMIIRGGENLFPAEIETAILEHPEVAEAAVVGVPDDTWGELVACFMRRPSDGASGPGPDAAALKGFIRERLSPQKTPTYWIWVSEWPLTGSGKIQKFALREMFVRGDLQAL